MLWSLALVLASGPAPARAADGPLWLRTLIVSQSDKEAVDLLDVALIARVEVQEKNASGS